MAAFYPHSLPAYAKISVQPSNLPTDFIGMGTGTLSTSHSPCPNLPGHSLIISHFFLLQVHISLFLHSDYRQHPHPYMQPFPPLASSPSPPNTPTPFLVPSCQQLRYGWLSFLRLSHKQALLPDFPTHPQSLACRLRLRGLSLITARAQDGKWS